jgi:hypothetical protein
LEKELSVGRTAKSAQRDRAGERDARIVKAKRRLELDKDKEARDSQIDQAVADVYLAQDQRDEAAKVIATAEVKMGAAIVRILVPSHTARYRQRSSWTAPRTGMGRGIEPHRSYGTRSSRRGLQFST